MGSVCSKCDEEVTNMRVRLQLLEKGMREQEKKTRKILVLKQEEWRKERERCKEENMAMRQMLEEEYKRRRAMEGVISGWKKMKQEELDPCCVMEKMRVEEERREEAVEKWKQLYLEIKSELDDLIHRTRQGEELWWESREEVIHVFQRELKAREEMMNLLRLRLTAMEQEGVKRDRETDILRQSLRILSAKKHNEKQRILKMPSC